MRVPARHPARVRWSLALFLFGCPAVAARAEAVDRILAVVGERVVTSTDVNLEDALAGHLGCPVPYLCDPSQETLPRLVDLAVIRGMAGDATPYRPSPDELEGRMVAVRASWGEASAYQAFLGRFGMTDDDLSGHVFSRMVVERYVERNVMLALSTRTEPQEGGAAYREWMGRQRMGVSIRYVAALSTP